MRERKVISIPTGKKALHDFFDDIHSMIESGEIESVIGIGITKDSGIMKFRSFDWNNRYFAALGGIESLKNWMIRDGEEEA